nr:hypothetical protein [Candidatus Sigynarchaeota archaeon]
MAIIGVDVLVIIFSIVYNNVGFLIISVIVLLVLGFMRDTMYHKSQRRYQAYMRRSDVQRKMHRTSRLERMSREDTEDEWRRDADKRKLPGSGHHHI